MHATGQVADLEAQGGPSPERATDALNAVLPDDIAVRAAEEAPDAFHARFSARTRSYRYRVLAGPSRSALDARRARSGGRVLLDLDALQAGADLLLGEHDFRAFTPTETQHGEGSRMRRSSDGRGTPGEGSRSKGGGQAGDPYILYLPRSSSDRFSSHFCSRPTSTLSWAVSRLRALRDDVLPRRRCASLCAASAIASEGRASIVTVPSSK